METLRTLREQVLSWLDESGDTGTTKKNVDYAINQSIVKRLTMTNWPFMKHGPITFNFVADQQIYSLHQDFLRPFYFRNKKTGRFLIEIPDRELEGSQANWFEDREGVKFRWGGRSPVLSQPNGTITIVSGSSLDTGSTKKITVYGETTNGLDSEDLIPQGTDEVTGLKTFTKILGITKASSWSGTLTVSSGGVTLLNLLPTEFGRSYQTIHLLFKPSSTDEIEYDFYRRPRKLVNDNDIPDTPYPYSLIHVWDALLDLTAYDGRIDPGRIQIWGKNQMDLETQMRNDFLEGRAIGSRPRKIRDVLGDFDDF